MDHDALDLLEMLVSLAKQVEVLSQDLIESIERLLNIVEHSPLANEFDRSRRDAYEAAIAALRRLLDADRELRVLADRTRQSYDMLDTACFSPSSASGPWEHSWDDAAGKIASKPEDTGSFPAVSTEQPKPAPRPQASSGGGSRCPVCGAPVPAGFDFCTSCGSPVGRPNAAPGGAFPGAPAQMSMPPKPASPKPAPRPKASSGGSWCPVCGAPVPAGFSFCTTCGSPVGRPNAAPGGAFPGAPAQMSAPPMSAASAPPAEKNVTLSKVRFSAVAPRRLVKGDYSILHMVMYEEQYRKVVDEILRESEAPMQETRGGTFKVREDAEVRVVLRSPDIEIEDNTREQLWEGDYLNFTFPILLPEDYKKRQVLFFADVYLNDLIATKLSFTANCVSLFEQKLKITRSDILSAFVSYAREDRARVASIIQGMQKARPDMDVFFDVETLRSGEDWEKALLREIDSRDMLFLCWSRNARDSSWVDAEWRFALDRKGIDCIEPIPLDPPDVCPPPEELKKKHFNDRLLYIIKAEKP